MQMNDKIQLTVLVYFVLQVALLLLLPKWWRQRLAHRFWSCRLLSST